MEKDNEIKALLADEEKKYSDAVSEAVAAYKEHTNKIRELTNKIDEAKQIYEIHVQTANVITPGGATRAALPGDLSPTSEPPEPSWRQRPSGQTRYDFDQLQGALDQLREGPGHELSRAQSRMTQVILSYVVGHQVSQQKLLEELEKVFATQQSGDEAYRRLEAKIEQLQANGFR